MKGGNGTGTVDVEKVVGHLKKKVSMAQVRTQEVEEGSRSEKHVEVAGGRWVRESQPVSGVANPGAWGRGTDNQDGGVSRRSWLLMR